jgi:hypothetical protein
MASPAVGMMDDFNYPYGFGAPAYNPNVLQEDYRRDSVTTTEGSVLTYSSGHSPLEPTSFDNAVTPEDTAINHNDIFNCGMNGNFPGTFQQHTPALSTGFDNFETLSFSMNNPLSAALPHLSPGAQPDVTLFSPHLHADEGYNEAMPSFDRPTGDFTLFDTTQSNNMNINTTANFFPDINQLGGQFDNAGQFDDSLYADPPMSAGFDDMMMGNFDNLPKY